MKPADTGIYHVMFRFWAWVLAPHNWSIMMVCFVYFPLLYLWPPGISIYTSPNRIGALGRIAEVTSPACGKVDSRFYSRVTNKWRTKNHQPCLLWPRQDDYLAGKCTFMDGMVGDWAMRAPVRDMIETAVWIQSCQLHYIKDAGNFIFQITCFILDLISGTGKGMPLHLASGRSHP